jgi:hypothetical protein
MGSCAAKPKRFTRSHKILSITDVKVVKSDEKSSFLNPEIRAKILRAKDAKAPTLNLQENNLRSSRLSRLTVEIKEG